MGHSGGCLKSISQDVFQGINLLCRCIPEYIIVVCIDIAGAFCNGEFCIGGLVKCMAICSANDASVSSKILVAVAFSIQLRTGLCEVAHYKVNTAQATNTEKSHV